MTTPPPRIPPGKAPSALLENTRVKTENPENSAVEVLLIGSSHGTRALFHQVFERSNWRLDGVGSVNEALAKLRNNPKAVVIYEDPFDGPHDRWLDLLEETRNFEHPPKVIVASRHADDRLWAEVLHQGGYDVMPMPLEAPEVLRTVSMAWLEWRREQEAPHRALAAAAR